MNKKKLSQQDFDAYLGKGAYYSKEDKEQFFSKMNKAKNNKRQWLPQILTFAMIVGIFIVGYQALQGSIPFFSEGSNNAEQRINEYRDTKGIVFADSEEEVWTYFQDKTPGLIRAESLGLVSNVQTSYKIRDEKNLHIEKIWYTDGAGYLFYSVEMPNIGKGKAPLQIPQIYNLIVNKINDEVFNEEFYLTSSPYNGREDGIIFENRLYKSIAFIDTFTYQEIETMNSEITIELNGEMTTVENVELPIHYSTENEITIKESINQSISEGDITMTFNELEIHLDGIIVDAEIQAKKGHRLAGMDGYVLTNNGEKVTLNFTGVLEENKVQFIGEALNQIPETATIYIESLDFVSDNDSIQFSLDVSEYKDETDSQINIRDKLTSLMNTDVYLESVKYEDHGVSLTLKYDVADTSQDLQLIPGMVLDAERFKDANPSYVFPLLISAVNEEGINHVFNDEVTSNDASSILVYLDSDYVLESKKIDFTIENILFTKKINQEFNFTINEE